jgi:ribosomal protein S18 acetylase RimI-like enzyme
MRIEQANYSNQEDIEHISAIEDAVFFENALGEGTLRREIEYGYCAVLRDDMDVIVGFALVRPHFELHDLLRLGVMPCFQGRGYGSWLLSHVITRFPGPMMLMVRKNNARAISLYERNNFVITGTTGESWVMRRSTSESP